MSPISTVRGEPTTASRKACSTPAFSTGLHNPFMESTGGGSWSGWPRRSSDEGSVGARWRGVARLRRSVSAAKHVASRARRCGLASAADGLEVPRGRSRAPRRAARARNARRRRRAGRASAASCAPNRLEPRIQIGTFGPAPGTARDGLVRRRPARNSACSSTHVLREAVGDIAERAAQRPRGALVGAGRAAEAEIDAAGIQRVERAELLGDHQRRVVGQHDAARADPDGPGAARATCAITTAVAALAMPGML